MAKTELRLKRMKQELDERKFQLSLQSKDTNDDYDVSDDIVIIE